MKKLTKEILERDAKRDIGAEIMEAIREIKAGGGRRFSVHVSQATEARLKLGMSQTEFATMLGVSARTAGLGAGPPATEWRGEGVAKGRDRIAQGCAQGVDCSLSRRIFLNLKVHSDPGFGQRAGPAKIGRPRNPQRCGESPL